VTTTRPVRAERGRPLRLGVVGCGRAATAIHLPLLAGLPEIEVAALADPDPAALGRALAAAPRARAVGDPRALLDDAAVDAVAICTPAAAHAELAVAALDAGKHLLIEKPLALTLADCDRIAARAAGERRVVTVGLHTRWHRFARRARELLTAGELGPIELVRSTLTARHLDVPAWRQRRATGGGVVLEMAVHHFDLWRYLLGVEVDTVVALSRAGAWEDEAAAIGGRLADGTPVAASFAERTTAANRLELCGRDASLALDFYRFDGFEIVRAAEAPGAWGARFRGALRTAAAVPRAVAGLRDGGEWRRAYREQWRQFAAAVRAGVVGAPEGGATLRDGRQALAVALAVAEAATRGAAARVPG